MNQNYLQTLVDLIFPKDQILSGSVNSKDFGDKKVVDLDISVWVATGYNDSVVHDLIHRVKVNNEFSFADDLSDIFNTKVKERFVISNRTLIITVPPDPKRLLENGFTLSTILAMNLSKSLGLDYTELLQKKKNTKKQSYLNREERLVNLHNKIDLYEAKINVANYDEIWIIDDITTTGATLFECQKVIQKNYPFVEVKLLALASN
jgi:competence protein ComFC